MARTRTHYTADQRERILAEYRTRRTTAAEFAADQGIKLTTLRAWLSGRPASARSAQSRSAVRFVAVDAKYGSRDEVEIRIGEVTIRVSSGAGAEFVAELVSLLAKSSC